jgi:hypothetical protein
VQRIVGHEGVGSSKFQGVVLKPVQVTPCLILARLIFCATKSLATRKVSAFNQYGDFFRAAAEATPGENP